MPNFTLRGPSKLGASQAASGEEALTAAVVAAYASVDEATAKRDGPLLAAKVLPTRRELWRLAEMYEPRRLAAALRARCDPSDQSGRGGVRELREALADWLDPPKRCRVCRRPIRAGTELVGCPGLPQRVGRFGKSLMRKPCKAPPGHPLKYSRAHGNRDCNGRMKDGLTLSLFTPVQLDTSTGGCMSAAAKLAKHGGGAAYDLVVDRDCRILFAAVRLPKGPAYERPDRADDGRPDVRVAGQAERSPRPENKSNVLPIHPAVLGALRRMDRAMDRAMRANGRLVLGVQSRYFSPKGSVTRADLLQGGADGLRRALLDYDPNFKPAGKKSGVAISTYAINWIYQGCGAVFSGRDLVDVPDWARRLRRDVEDLGVDPGVLHGAIDAAVEAWGMAEGGGLRVDPRTGKETPLSAEGLAEGCVALAILIARGFSRVAAEWARKPAGETAEERMGPLGRAARIALGFTPVPLRGKRGDRGAFVLWKVLRVAAEAKKGGQAERVRERLAACVGALLGLDCKGPALLTALRYGAAQVVSEVGTGERSDGDGDGAGGGGHGGDSGGRGGRLDRAAEHLREEADDAEARAAEEQEAGQRRRAAYAALERVRARDPEAAEVVRRRHGLDGAGEPETFEALASAPLRCSGRRMCRESLRKLYVSATREMAATAPDLLGAAVIVADCDTAPAVTMQEHHETAGAASAAFQPTDAAMAAVRTFAARRAPIEGQRSAPVIRRRPTCSTSREQFGLLAGPPPAVAHAAPDGGQGDALDLPHALA